jgi:hypothetical protein
MRRLLPIAVFSLVLVAGCGGSKAAETAPPPASPTPSPIATATVTAVGVKSSRTYARADLPRLALQQRNAPRDMRQIKGETGFRTLEQIGLILPRQVKEARSFGFKALYDSVFASTSKLSDRRVAERVWLFKNAKGASRWLARSKADAASLEFDEIAARRLGEESWAARGLIQIGGGEVITYAFRLGNGVFVVTTYGQQTPVDPAAARAAAEAALARARKV